MRLGVTIAKLIDGSYQLLALPDCSVQTQRDMVKKIITDDGRVTSSNGGKGKRLAEVLYFETVTKRKRFDEELIGVKPLRAAGKNRALGVELESEIDGKA